VRCEVIFERHVEILGLLAGWRVEVAACFVVCTSSRECAPTTVLPQERGLLFVTLSNTCSNLKHSMG
jgi:hypothetical protein